MQPDEGFQGGNDLAVQKRSLPAPLTAQTRLGGWYNQYKSQVESWYGFNCASFLVVEGHIQGGSNSGPLFAPAGHMIYCGPVPWWDKTNCNRYKHVVAIVQPEVRVETSISQRWKRSVFTHEEKQRESALSATLLSPHTARHGLRGPPWGG